MFVISRDSASSSASSMSTIFGSNRSGSLEDVWDEDDECNLYDLENVIADKACNGEQIRVRDGGMSPTNAVCTSYSIPLYNKRRTADGGIRVTYQTELPPIADCPASSPRSVKIIVEASSLEEPLTAQLYSYERTESSGGIKTARRMMAYATMYIIERDGCQGSFIEAGDMHSQDMHELTVSYFNDFGILRKGCAPGARDDPESAFLFIHELEVNPEFSGEALGIRFLDAILHLFHPYWGLCVLMPCPLPNQKWKHRTPILRAAGIESLYRYYGRLGFSKFRQKKSCVACPPHGMFLCRSKWETHKGIKTPSQKTHRASDSPRLDLASDVDCSEYDDDEQISLLEMFHVFFEDKTSDGNDHISLSEFDFEYLAEDAEDADMHCYIRTDLPASSSSRVLSIDVHAYGFEPLSWTAELCEHDKEAPLEHAARYKVVAQATFRTIERGEDFIVARNTLSDSANRAAALYFDTAGEMIAEYAPDAVDDHKKGYIHIDEIEVNPKYAGNSYGLHIINEVLDLFHPWWGVCVLVADKMSSSELRWQRREKRSSRAGSSGWIERYLSRAGFKCFKDSYRLCPSAMYLCELQWKKWKVEDDSTSAGKQLTSRQDLQYSEQQKQWQCQVMDIANKDGSVAAAKEVRRIFTCIHDNASVNRAGIVQCMLKVGAGTVDLQLSQNAGERERCDRTISERDMQAFLRQVSQISGFDISSPDAAGNTVLHACVNYGYSKVLRTALRRGADPMVRTLDGNVSALDMAMRKSSMYCGSESSVDYFDLVIKPLLDAVPAVLRRRSPLLERWMTQEVKLAFICAANQCRSRIRGHVGLIGEQSVERSRLLPLFNGSIPLDHIPDPVPKAYVDGYRLLFRATVDTLCDNFELSVERLRWQVHDINKVALRAFEDAGGRVEYVLAEIMNVLTSTYDADGKKKEGGDEDSYTKLFPELGDDPFNDLGFVRMMVFRTTRFVPSGSYPNTPVGMDSLPGYYDVAPLLVLE